MNKPRGNTPKTYRLSEQTISRIAGLQKQYDISTATNLVTYAIDQLWESHGDQLRPTHAEPVQPIPTPAPEPENVSQGQPQTTNQVARRKSWAEIQREQLEAKAAAAGVCPDCGDKAEWCSCVK